MNQNLAKLSASTASNLKLNAKAPTDQISTLKIDDKQQVSNSNELTSQTQILSQKLTPDSNNMNTNRKIAERSRSTDLELGLMKICDENRGLTTDMLGIPTNKQPDYTVKSISDLTRANLYENSSRREINLKKLLNNHIETLDTILYKL